MLVDREAWEKNRRPRREDDILIVFGVILVNVGLGDLVRDVEWRGMRLRMEDWPAESSEGLSAVSQ